MSKFALIKAGKVENVIEAKQAHIDNIKSQYDNVINVDKIPAGPGWSYDGTSFTAPTPTPQPKVRVISREEFRSRFTQAEKQAIYKAKATNIDIEIWLDDVQAADSINLDDSQITSGIDALVKAGLITKARATKILS